VVKLEFVQRTNIDAFLPGFGDVALARIIGCNGHFCFAGRAAQRKWIEGDILRRDVADKALPERGDGLECENLLERLRKLTRPQSDMRADVERDAATTAGVQARAPVLALVFAAIGLQVELDMRVTSRQPPCLNALHGIPGCWSEARVPAQDAPTELVRGRRYVARDPGDVHIVVLVGVQELLGVGLVDLLPHENVEEIRVDVAVELEFSEYGQRLGQRLALLVGSVLRRERLEDIGDPHAPRLNRHLLALEAPRVAFTI